MALLYALSFALHLYIGLRIVPMLAGTGWVLTVVLVVSALSVPLGLVARRFAKPPLADKLAWLGLFCMGLFSSLLVLTFLRDVSLLFFRAEDYGLYSAQAVTLGAALMTALGWYNARRTPPIKRVEVKLPGLPPALDGFRIVQISDVHVGPTIRRRHIDAIVDRVNALDGDVVAVTGDLVDGTVAELQPHVAPLGRMRAKHGVYFVTGNHEYYSGAGPWIREVQRLGMRVLMNEHVIIERGEAQLVLAGVADYSAGQFDRSHASDPVRALAGAPAEAPKVLLAHQPRTAAAAAAAGFDLQISGHTHGGQFLPWNLFVPLQQPFTAGLHRLGKLLIYVSRGTGYWGPPKRVGAPSEIGEITLRAA